MKTRNAFFMPFVAQQVRNIVLLVLILGAIGGCGPRATFAPVSGAITLEGKPLGPGRIVFLPIDQLTTGAKPAVGEFSQDGIYRLTTPHGGEGAAVGSYHVIVQSLGDDTPMASPSHIPPQYGNAGNALLKATVKPGIDNKHDFDLARNGNEFRK